MYSAGRSIPVAGWMTEARHRGRAVSVRSPELWWGLRLGRVEQWVGAGLIVEARIESVDPMALDDGREA